jgi:hypothetical protein
MKYFLIKETSSELFSDKINDRLKNGWLLHGETFVYKVDESIFYTQAVIKKEENKNNTPVIDDSIGQIIASWNC